MTVCGTGDWTGPLPGDPDNNYTISAQATFGGINVSWSYPQINPQAVSYFQLYKGTTAVFAEAIEFAIVAGNSYYHKIDSDQAQYYWIRLRSVNGTVGALVGPASATPSFLTSTLIEAIAGDITSSTLSLELNTRIDGINVLRSDIDADIASITLVNAALSQALGDTDAAVTQATAMIAQETANRTAQAAALAQGILDATVVAEADLSTEVGLITDKLFRESKDRADSVQETAEALLRSILLNERVALDAAGSVASARSEIRTDIIEGLSAEASQRAILASNMESADAVTTALISSESAARSDAIAAEAVQRDLLAAQFRGSYTGTDLAALTEGLLYQERIARATQDSSLIQQLTLLSAGAGEQFDWKSIWYFDTGVESWAGNGTPTSAAGYLRPANQATSAYVESPISLAIDHTKYSQVRLRVRKTGTVAWAGYLYWKTTGDLTWDAARRTMLTEPTYDLNGIGLVTITVPWAGNVQQIRIDLSSAQTTSNYMELDWVAVGRPSPGASSAQLLEEQTVRSSETLALSSSLTSLSSQVNDPVTGLGNTRTELLQEYTTRATAIAAEANARGLLAARVTTAETGLQAAESAIVNEASTRATDDQANAAATLALSSQVNNAVTGLPATRASLVEFQSTQATVNTASAFDIKTLSAKSNTSDEAALTALLAGEATLNSSNAGLALVRQELQTNITEGLLAEATSRIVLAVQLDTATANIVNEETARVTQDTALAQSIAALGTEITDPASGLKTRATALETLTTNAVFGNSALATRASALESTVNTAGTGLSARATALETLTTAAVSGNSALAGRATSLETSVNTPVTGLAARAVALETLTTAANSGNSALASRATNLETTVNTAGTGLSARAAALETLTTAVNSGNSALATRATTLETSVNTAGTGLTARATALETLTTAVNSGNSALATRASNLEAVVNNATTGVVATANALDTVELLVNNGSSGVTATAGKVTTLTAKIDSPTAANNATYATLVNSYRTTALTDTAISTAVNAVISNLNTATGFYSSIANTKITAESKSASFVQATAPTATKTNDLWVDTANGNLLKRWNSTAWVVADDTRIGTAASSITTLQSSLSGLTSSVQQEITTRASETGALFGQYSIKMDLDGYVSGFGLQSSLTTGGTPTSTFLMSVDKFAVAMPTSSITNWVASTTYSVSTIRGVAGNTTKVLICKQAGQSGTVTPDITGVVGTVITDNTAKWQIASRVPFSVMTASSVVNGITVPAGTYIDGAYITNASISSAQIGSIDAGTITTGLLVADRIDSRGLSIKDASGNVILAAGNALDFNTRFGSNTTGLPANNATVGATAGTNLVDASGAVLTDAKVKNGYTENGVTHVMRPEGGSYNGGAGGMTGYIKIRLPQSWTDSMIRFFIDVYEYGVDASVTYEVGGYNGSGGTWINTYARAVGNPANVRAVRFGHDGTKCCVFLGSLYGTLQYPVVQIRDVVVGFSAQALANWQSGWQVGVQNLSGELTTVGTVVIAKPLPGGAMSGIDKIDTGNASTYIANAAIDLAQIKVASIGSLSALSANLGTVIVNSINIAGNAVTVPISATTGNPPAVVVTNTTETTILTTGSIDTRVGGVSMPISLVLSFELAYIFAISQFVRTWVYLKMSDGTTVTTLKYWSYRNPTGTGTFLYPRADVSLISTPPNVPVFFYLSVKAETTPNAINEVEITGATILGIGTKR